MTSKKHRVDSMRRGDIFRDNTGAEWMFLRKDGALSGAYHCERSDGFRSTFAGCAEFETVARPEVFVETTIPTTREQRLVCPNDGERLSESTDPKLSGCYECPTCGFVQGFGFFIVGTGSDGPH